MKPEEILSMIEEAAGTRMFETKKQAALKTIEKKQLKVDEFTRVMENEISPTLDQLRGERENYQQYMNNSHELVRMERFCIAFEFTALKDKVIFTENAKLGLQRMLAELETTHDEKMAEADEVGKKINTMKAQLDGEAVGGLSDLKNKEDESSKDLVKVDANLKNQKESCSSEKSLLVSLDKQGAIAKSTLADKQQEQISVDAEYTLKEADYLRAEGDMLKQREKYQNACAGIADVADAELLSIPEQVGAWEKKLRETESQLQQNDIRLAHCKKTIGEKKKFSKSEEAEYTKAMSEVEGLRSNVAAAQCECEEATSRSVDEDALRRDIGVMRKRGAELKDTVEALSAQLEARLSFDFRDPMKGFDRSKVRGLVARLVQVADTKAVTALEVTAGGKLFQVVVDTEQTGKLLLDHGQLKKRVTILPLNKLNARCVEAGKLNLAKNIAAKMGGSALLAIELVGFEEDVRKAMELVFGATIICDTSAVAKAIAFDKNISTKTVTFEGDVYDPSGTLTGGSSSQIGSILAKLHELSIAQHSLGEVDKELAKLHRDTKIAETANSATRQAGDRLLQLQQALQVCEDRINESKYAQALVELTELERSIMAFERESAELKEASKKAKHELKQLNDTASSSSKKRDVAMKEMESATRTAQKYATTLKASLTTLKHRKDVLAAEVETLIKEIATLADQRAICDKGIIKMQEGIEALATLVLSKKAVYENFRVQVVERQNELSRCSKEIKLLESGREQCVQAANEAALQLRKLSNDFKEADKHSRDLAATLAELLNEHLWIEAEKVFFGKTGSEYVFEAKEMKSITEKRASLKSDQVLNVWLDVRNPF
jgi:structural maintenance of chromosome 2